MNWQPIVFENPREKRLNFKFLFLSGGRYYKGTSIKGGGIIEGTSIKGGGYVQGSLICCFGYLKDMTIGPPPCLQSRPSPPHTLILSPTCGHTVHTL